ncbi:tetratricopeptide repeat protein [Afifella sp. JA880]|uniref:heme biosynthesis HemY N-terminal domain-containing protein n=1 Tax=Afifella sp. JA880 TaxID=2975280 RepID=UPI0021BAC2EA|nr:heme biosynthesis HemY N-terminal domain-containing protein [Afifella sp. JA880]MCT8268604.1 tetratricopeptide repeat protein [Afifella sp. JA880]
MIRFLILIAVVFAFVLGFSWLKEAPGEVTLTFADTAYTIGLARAALAALLALAAGFIIVGLIVLILRFPWKARQSWRRRRERRQREALSTGLLAVAAGDLRTAERASHDLARRDDEPLALLLRAQTAQLRGDHAKAREAFKGMLGHDRTRIVGLRGLFIEAAREGDHDTARAFAEQARETSPSAAWASRALMRYQTAEGSWEEALKTLSRYAETGDIDRKEARRLRAVILTAQAIDWEDGQPDKAKEAALEAHGLQPDLVPAAVLAGRLSSRLGDIRRATRVLETTWKANPHPDIADAYANVRPGDSARDRFQRLETLMKLRPQEDAARMVMARAAIGSRDWERARETLLPMIRTRPTQNALLMMAEIEEGEHGDRGRAREWLSRAVHAPRDPAWTADGVILDEWAPVSPVTGRIDTVEWKVPIEEPESRRTIDIDEASFRPREISPLRDESSAPTLTATPVSAASAASGASTPPTKPAGGKPDTTTIPAAGSAKAQTATATNSTIAPAAASAATKPADGEKPAAAKPTDSPSHAAAATKPETQTAASADKPKAGPDAGASSAAAQPQPSKTTAILSGAGAAAGVGAIQPPKPREPAPAATDTPTASAAPESAKSATATDAAKPKESGAGSQSATSFAAPVDPQDKAAESTASQAADTKRMDEKPSTTSPAASPTPASVAPSAATTGSPASANTAPKRPDPLAEGKGEPPKAPPVPVDAPKDAHSDEEDASARANGGQGNRPRLPDDPGPEEKKPDEEAGRSRFRLF